MNIFHLFSELIYLTIPFLYPLGCVFFCWLIWLLFKWRNWPRPNLSIMLLFTTSIGITYIQSWQGLNACLKNPSCDPDPSLPFVLFPLLAEVSFWLIALYVPVTLALKPKVIIDQRKNWWIVLLIVAFAIWHIFEFGPFSIIRELIYFNLIATDIFFYTVIGFTVPWIVWWFLGNVDCPRPSLQIMFIYSIAAINASTRLWVGEIMCNIISHSCEVNFSLLLFAGEIALWFIPLYALMKLISRMER